MRPRPEWKQAGLRAALIRRPPPPVPRARLHTEGNRFEARQTLRPAADLGLAARNLLRLPTRGHLPRVVALLATRRSRRDRPAHRNGEGGDELRAGASR